MKAYEQGYKDFKNGNLDNPYRETSKSYKDWQRGFDKAYFDNLQQVEPGGRSQEVHC